MYIDERPAATGGTDLRILLVNPPVNGALFGAGNVTLPLGLAYIAAVAEGIGHHVRVRVLDMTVQEDPGEGLVNLVSAVKPHIIGFTVVTPTASAVCDLIKLAKSRFSEARIVLGGPHATALPEECLMNGADIVVRGEGEETFRELLERDGKPKGVTGLSYRENEDIIHNPPRPSVQDLDSLPLPARHLFPSLASYSGQPALGNLVPTAGIMTSRGCPHRCVFCFTAGMGSRMRMRSPENVVKEWRILKEQYQVREIAIADDCFTANQQRVVDICAEIRRTGLVLPWSCRGGLRVDMAKPRTLEAIKEAGCYRVAFGVESGNQEILNRIGKACTLAQARDAFKHARRLGLETVAFFMMGNPGETIETMEDTIRFAAELDPDFVQFTPAVPYPGTPLYEIVRSQGKLTTTSWDAYGSYTKEGYFELGKVNPKLVGRMIKRGYRSFYLSGRYIKRFLHSRRVRRHIWRRIRAAWYFLR